MGSIASSPPAVAGCSLVEKQRILQGIVCSVVIGNAPDSVAFVAVDFFQIQHDLSLVVCANVFIQQNGHLVDGHGLVQTTSVDGWVGRHLGMNGNAKIGNAVRVVPFDVCSHSVTALQVPVFGIDQRRVKFRENRFSQSPLGLLQILEILDAVRGGIVRFEEVSLDALGCLSIGGHQWTNGPLQLPRDEVSR